MKTLGLIGGMSAESTIPYYRLINQGIARRLGGLHSARLLLYSVDFADIEVLQRENRWEAAGELLADCARVLQAGGAQGLVICTNTMHKVAAAIEAAVDIPLLHIADAVAAALLAQGKTRVGLLATRFTMEQSFYRDRLAAQGIETITPPQEQRDLVHRVIYEELCQGRIEAASREQYRHVMTGLVERGAQAIVLGCTEIGLLVDADDCSVPLFDTTALHAAAAVEFALG